MPAEKIEATLSHIFLIKLFVLAGVAGGLISAIIYIVIDINKIAIWEAALVIFLAPLFQAFTLLIYSVIGYLAYRYLVKRRLLKFHEIEITR